MKMKKVNKTIYCLEIKKDCGEFYFHIWAYNIKEAKELALEVYNNKNYNENLPKDRELASINDVIVKKVYNRETESHVVSVTWMPKINNSDDYRSNCVNSFIDEISKIIDNFEEGV